MHDKRPERRHFEVGDKVRVNLQGSIATATIRKILRESDGIRLKVDLGMNKLAVVEPWQIRKRPNLTLYLKLE